MRITDKQILSLTSNRSVLINAELYQVNGFVKNLVINNKTNEITASVEKDGNFNVKIRVSQTGAVESYRCSCPFNSEFFGACKHVVATMKQAQIELNQVLKAQQEKNDFIQEIFDQYDSQINSINKKKLHVEIHLDSEEINLFNKTTIRKYLYFRIGEEKLYVVKDIQSLIESIDKQVPLEFGKQFTFNPAIHSLPLFFKEILRIAREINSMSSSIYDQPFTTKKMYANDYLLKRILPIIKNETITINLNGNEVDVKQTDDSLPFSIEVEDQDNEIHLLLSTLNGLMPITSDYEYCLLNESIYQIPHRQTKIISAFIKASLNNMNEIILKDNDRANFVSKILPFLNRSIGVEIPETISKQYIQADFQANIYLDKEGNTLILRPTFSYGDIEFNPFSNDMLATDEGKIIIRDDQKEYAIMNILESIDLKVAPDYLYTSDDKTIFNLVYEILPVLQGLATIYYADNFKSLFLSTSFKTSIRLNESSQLLEVDLDMNGIDPSELKDILDAYKKKRKYYRLKDGSFLEFNNNTDYLELLDQLDIDEDSINGNHFELPLSKSLYLKERLQEFDSYVDPSVESFIQTLVSPDNLDIKVPNTINGTLREYQITGFKWLKTLSHYHLGGILADDMGLGKTLQTITFLASEQDVSKKSALIVCPSSLVYNWQNEIKKFSQTLSALVIHGNPEDRKNQIALCADFDIIITSYPLLRRDIDEYENIIFDYIFIDEAQHIKNPNSLNAETVKKIKSHHYFALTGTPIENSLTELWSIFDFIMKGYLSNHHRFREKYEKPIVRDNDAYALNDLSRQIKPFIMRRMKKDVLTELPEKIETKISIEMTEEQKKLYLANLQAAKKEIKAELEVNGFEKSTFKILAVLMKLRQICCHPSLFLEDYNGGSGKEDVLLEIINNALEGGHRVLVFSQFVSMLKIIEDKFKDNNTSYYYLDGSTPVEERLSLVDSFNQGNKDVFLISLKAGGTGLNLTGADVVIHYDPWWNPAVEDQATDRAYRIGQNNSVQVFKLITKGTIEDKIFDLQEKKKELINSVIQPGETFVNKLNEEELKEIFEL